MGIQEIVDYLAMSSKRFQQIQSFSKSPGIYSILFDGENFPVFNHIVKGNIIYIGKTESSQERRDAKTHYATGKTGSSTLRKSIGALLYDDLDLKAIPRNEIDYKKGRYSHYKFQDECEEKITNWMINNLSLAFYEYPKSKKDIDILETNLIRLTTPILNLSKNSNNIYKKDVKTLRSYCAKQAFNNCNYD